jgi:hypothetical protein
MDPPAVEVRRILLGLGSRVPVQGSRLEIKNPEP